MPKYKELHPFLYKYFKNLFQDSKKFKEKVNILRKKYNIQRNEGESFSEYLYGDRVMFFKICKEAIEERYSTKDKKLYNNFTNDIIKLAKEYFLDNYINEFRNYILGGGFDPLFQRELRCSKDGIQINLPLSITKSEFDKYWNQILKAKEFAKNNFLKGINPGTKYKESTEFDTKIALYKYKNEGYTPTKFEKLKISNIEPVQVEKWLNEVTKWLELLNKS